MAKPILLKTRAAILAAIYNPELLPSAIISVSGHSPYCLHSLRENDLSLFEDQFVDAVRAEFGTGDLDDEKVVLKLYPFFEDYPDGSHTCHGCYFGKNTERHDMRDNAEACTKTTEECA